MFITMALESPAAFGEKIYYPDISLGEPGSGISQLNEPVGLAVNNKTGDVYVADQGNRRVAYFSSTGAFQGQFNGSGGLPNEKGKKAGGGGNPGEIETGQFSSPEQVAVDNTPGSPSFGDVYVTDTKVSGEEEVYSLVDKFSPTGEYLGQITKALVCEGSKKPPPCPKGEKEEMAPLRKLRGIAVDTGGDLWVYGGVGNETEGSYVFEFNSSGGFVKELSSGGFAHKNHAIAVDSRGDVFLGIAEGEYLFTFIAQGAVVAEPCFAVSGSKAMAVVPASDTQLADEVLVDKENSIVRDGPYSPCGLELEAFPGKNVPPGYGGLSESFGVAVGGSGVVYASERGAGRVEGFEYVAVPGVVTGPPSVVTGTSITFDGTVNPEGEEIKECFFEYGTKVGVYTGKAQCGLEASKITGGQPVAVSATVEDLEPADVRSFRLVAVTAKGVFSPGEGLSVSGPVVSGEGVLSVGSSEATAVAQVNPGGLETCFTVEYCVGETSQEECLPAGSEPVGVSVELVGLAPDSECQFSVVAHNALNVSVSEGFVFKTFAPASSGLPDGRVGEAVSAVGVGNAVEVYVPPGLVSAGLDYNDAHGIFAGAPSQVALDGEAAVYVGDPPATGGDGNFGKGGGNSYAARRDVGGGWTQVSLNAPGYGNEYLAFAGDVSAGVLQSGEELEAGVTAGYNNLFRRSIGWQLGYGGLYKPRLGAFEPLISVVLPCAVKDVGAFEGGKLQAYVSPGGGNAGGGVVSAFGHLLFEVDAALPSMPVAPSTVTGGGEGCGPRNDLYDYVGGQLYLVNVMPDGEAEAGGTFGRGGSSADEFLSPEKSNAVSADGSRIYWSTVAGWTAENEDIPKALYVRKDDMQPQSEVEEVGKGRWRCTEVGKACTVQVDASENPGEEEGGGGAFWTASSDGSRAFFTDERKLVGESTAELAKPDLYEFDVEAPEGERLSDVSSAVRPGVHADVEGVVGASEDGSYVYFVADGALTEGANAEGREPVEGQPNLYLRHGGQTVFVATLLPRDDNFTEDVGDPGNYGDWQADPAHRTAEVTPDGHSVVFTSRNRLTSYDNTLEGTPLAEVYSYDAVTERLVCVSCNPSGEAPTANIYPEFAEDISQSEELGEGHKVLGSFLPSSEGVVGWADYQPRVVSGGGGRVFFDSVEPLVGGVGGGFLNVYEWEAPGVGSCTRAGASPVTGGCTYLLSGGESSENSYLIDASGNGNDVFFISREQVSGVNREGYDVLYDARVGGVASPQPERCAESGCQGAPPAAAVFATPAASTFEGPPNPSPRSAVKCAKGKKLRKGVCVKAKPKPRHRSKPVSRGSKRKVGARLRHRGGRSGGLGRAGR